MENFDEVELNITPEKLFEMKKSGMTYDEIAKEIGAKSHNVGGVFRVLGLPTFGGRSVDLEPDEALRLAQEEDMTTAEIADEHDCTKATVERRLAEAVQD